MKQEEQEELLNQLAKTKIPSKFDEIADDVLIAEDPDEYWGIMDGILPNKLTVEEKKQVVTKVRELVPDARFIYIEPDVWVSCCSWFYGKR